MHIKKFLFLVVASLTIGSAYAQKTDAVTGATQHVDATASTSQHTDAVSGATRHSDGNQKAKTRRPFVSRLTLGGYGEATAKYAFYSNNWKRYTSPENYKNDRYGEFDLPHVVLTLGYDFGRGWSMGSEFEFEHGGTESAVEIEEEENGEYESEVERGGEVAIEQFWLQKKFADWAIIRAGMQIVPVGGTNAHHEPNQFFGVFRPEGDNTILPCTWHDVSLSFMGRYKWFGYQAMFLPGLDSERFGNKSWVHYGSASPYEFKLATCFAGAARFDFYPVDNDKDKLRLSLSGYAGTTFRNTLANTSSSKYDDVKGLLTIGSFDLNYQGHNWIVRGSATYGHLDDAAEITAFNKSMSKNSTSKLQVVASDAYSCGIEAGYDFFHFNKHLRDLGEKFYLFARYDAYDSQYRVDGKEDYTYSWCGRQRWAAGINYFPMPQIVIKAEYAYGLLNKAQNAEGNLYRKFNPEPELSLGIAYCGLFDFSQPKGKRYGTY